MSRQYFKRMLFIVSIFTCISIQTNAQNIVTHLVQRGETIESIASKYRVSIESIISDNPAVKQYVYVGQKLTIDLSKRVDTAETTGVVEITHTAEGNDVHQMSKVNGDSPSTYESKVDKADISDTPTKQGMADRARFTGDFLAVFPVSELKKNNFAMAGDFELGVRYYFSDNFFFSSLLGYSIGGATVKNGSNSKYQSWTHSMVMPFLLGIAVDEEEHFVGRLGAVLMYNIAGKTDYIVNGKVISTEKISDSPNTQRFSYGLQMNLKMYVDIGLRLLWTKDIKDPTVHLSVGFSF